MEIKFIIVTISAIAIMEGLILTLAPEKTRRIVLKSLKTRKSILNLGITELTAGLILLLLAFLL